MALVTCGTCERRLFSLNELCIFNPVRSESHLLLQPGLRPSTLKLPADSRDFFCAGCEAVIGHYQTFGIALKPLLVLSLRRISLKSEGKVTLEELKLKLKQYNWKDLPIVEEEAFTGVASKHKHLPLLHPTTEDLICFSQTLKKHPPRPYQWESLTMAALSPENSIIFLPTGAGKTLVAAMMCALYKRLNPDRLVVFLADRVPLVFQQARAIEEQTGLVCLAVAGDVQINLPPSELLQYDVLVCTVQLWINLLLKRESQEAGLLESVSLVVVDEVHHATRAHPFVVFFESFLNPLQQAQGWSPRVLGLTASPASGRGLQMKIQLEHLEATVQGRLCVPVLYRQALEEATQRPQLHFIPVPPFTAGQATFLNERVGELKTALEEALAVKLPNSITFEELRALVKTVKDGNQLAAIYRLFSRIELVNLIGREEEDSLEGNDEFSPKFKALVEFLQSLPVTEQSRVIIFVETKRAARLLSSFLKPRIDSSWNPQAFVGQATGSIEGMSWSDQQRPLLAMFHAGLVKLLVATSVLQEGLDVAACNHIVAFDRAWSLQAFLQSRGRARAQNSQYTVICAPDEQAHYTQLLAQESQMKGMVLKEMAERQILNLQVALTTVRLVKKIDEVETTELEIEESDESDSESEKDQVVIDTSSTLEDSVDADYFDVEAQLIDLNSIDQATPCTIQFPPIVLKRPLSLNRLSQQYLQPSNHYDLNVFDRVLGLNSSTLPVQLPFDSLQVGVMPTPSSFSSISEPLTGDSFIVDPIRQVVVIRCGNDFSIQCPFAFIDRFCLLTTTAEEEGVYSLLLPLRKPAFLFQGKEGEEKRCTAHVAPVNGFGEGNVLKLVLPLNASSAKYLLAALKNLSIRVLFCKTPIQLATFASKIDLSQVKSPYLISCMLSGTWQSSSMRIDQSFIESADELICQSSSVVEAFISAMNKSRFLDPLTVLHSIDPSKLPLPIEPESSFAFVKLVTWTPSRVIFHPPQLMMSNRVLRHFGAESFVRVHFRDDTGEKLSMSVGEGVLDELLAEEVKGSVGWYLKNHFCVDGKTFKFLAMSASQLRNHSAWFTSRDSDEVRAWLGDFRGIRNVAKYVARLGQSLSASQSVGVIEDFQMIPDWESEDGKFCFSDGCGRMSLELAERIAQELKLPEVPSAVQIRFAGFKGVVVVSRDARSQLALRPSMKKFECASRSLDVLNYSQAFPAFLNRQIILILCARGVPDAVFIQLQHDHLAELTAANPSTLRIPGLSVEAIPLNDPFKRALAHLHYQRAIKDLVTRSRIAVPQGRVLMGVVDETGLLGEGQVFCQIDGVGVIEGQIVVAKNPCMHPGDLRVLEAFRVNELMQTHRNVIVFPRRGARPIPDMCSGSDLDGDLYFVTWDTRLIPVVREEAPMDYSGLPAVELAEPVGMDDVCHFLLHYLANDQLGSIANAHMVFADRFEDGVKNPVCQSLARIFALAVDFPKTGFMAQLPAQARVSQYPDFMEKTDKPVYASGRIIGKLFRQLKQLASLMNSSSKLNTEDCPVGDEVDEGLKSVYFNYRDAIQECLRSYSCDSEAQLWLGLTGEVEDQFRDLSTELIESGQTRLRMIVAETRKALEPYANHPDLFKVCQGAATAFPWLIEHSSAPSRANTTKSLVTNLQVVLDQIYEQSVEIITECFAPLNELCAAFTVDWVAVLLNSEEISVSVQNESIDSLKTKCMEFNLTNSVQSDNTLVIKIGGKRLICHLKTIITAPAFKNPLDFWLLFCLKTANVSISESLPSAFLVNPMQFPDLLDGWMKWLAEVDAGVLVAKLKNWLAELSPTDSAAFTAYHLLVWNECDLPGTLSQLRPSTTTQRINSVRKSLRVALKPGSTSGGRSVDGALRLFVPVQDESTNSLTFTSFSLPRRLQSTDPCFRVQCLTPTDSTTELFADFWSYCHRQLALLSRMHQAGHEVKLTVRRGQCYASQVPSILLENPFSLKLLRMTLDRSFKKQRIRQFKQVKSNAPSEDRYDPKPVTRHQQRDQSKIHAALESLLNESEAAEPPIKKSKTSASASFFGKLMMHFEAGTGADVTEYFSEGECVYVCSLEVYDRVLDSNVSLRVTLDASFRATSIRSRSLRWIVADFVHADKGDKSFMDRRLILGTSMDLSKQFPVGYFDSLLTEVNGQLRLSDRFRDNESIHVRQMIPTNQANYFLVREFSLPDSRSGVFRLQSPSKVELEDSVDVDIAGLSEVSGREALIRKFWKRKGH